MAAARRKKPIKLKQLQQTIVRPNGIDFTSRYRLFKSIHNGKPGKIYILDRFNYHQPVFDVTNEDDEIQFIVRQQWNDDFALYVY